MSLCSYLGHIVGNEEQQRSLYKSTLSCQSQKDDTDALFQTQRSRYEHFWESLAIILNVSKIPSPLEKHVPMLLTKSGGQ